MSEPLISVIIPVYKVEEYLEKCVDSVLNQTMKELEIILVDDGSPDRCGEICDAYARKDSRVRVIHQENRGLSAARNAGIDVAACPYIGFVDSDDWIEPDMYEFLYENITGNHADIATCGTFGMIATRRDRRRVIECKTVTGEEALQNLLSQSTCTVYAWDKLYRRKVFLTARFPEGRTYEDIFLIPKLLGATKSVALSTIPKYHYIKRAGSITSTLSIKYNQDALAAEYALYAYLASEFPKYLPLMADRLSSRFFLLLDAMLMSEDPIDVQEKDKMIGYLRSRASSILKSRKFTNKRKLCFLPLLVHEKLYKLAIGFRYKKS